MQQLLKCQEGQRRGQGICGLSGVNCALGSLLLAVQDSTTEEGAKAACEMPVPSAALQGSPQQLLRHQAPNSSQQMELQMLNRQRAGSSQRSALTQ